MLSCLTTAASGPESRQQERIDFGKLSSALHIHCGTLVYTHIHTHGALGGKRSNCEKQRQDIYSMWPHWEEHIQIRTSSEPQGHLQDDCREAEVEGVPKRNA